MAINDTSPERRNLMVASVAFIIFYAGGAHPVDGVIKLLVVNLDFARPQMLGWAAWVILVWFILRFYQKHGFSFWNSLQQEIMKLKVIESIKNHVIPLAREQLSGAHKSDLFKKRITADCVRIDGTNLAVVCQFTSDSGAIVHQEIVKLKGLKGWAFSLRIVILQCINGNAFSEYLIPYILFIIAISAPIWGAYCVK